MVLSDKEIRDRCLSYQKYSMDAPLIEPFVEDQLQGASYDVTISNIIYTFKSEFQTIDIAEQDNIDSIYQEIDISDGYCIAPGQYILVTLNEKINVPKDLVAGLRPRTRFVRLGINVSDQHVNPLSTAILKIGIQNCTAYAINIYPNIGIGQLLFETLSSEPSENKLYKTKKGANYSQDINFVGSKLSDELKTQVNREYENLLKNMFKGD